MAAYQPNRSFKFKPFKTGLQVVQDQLVDFAIRQRMRDAVRKAINRDGRPQKIKPKFVWQYELFDMDEDRIEFAKLPTVADMDTEVCQRIITLLESLDQVVTEKAKLDDREDDIKLELQKLQHTSGRVGFRYGWLCFVAQSVAGRKTLDKMLLLENGVSAKTIESSYKEGKPGTRCTFKRLPETK